MSVAFLPDAAYRKEHCMNTNVWLVSMTGINILLDVCILVLPLSFIWTLQLSSKRKAGLGGIFMLGILYVNNNSLNLLYTYHMSDTAPLAQVLQGLTLSSGVTCSTSLVSPVPMLHPEEPLYGALFVVSYFL